MSDINPLAASTAMTDFLEAMQIDTPAIAWLREAGLMVEKRREQWAREELETEQMT